MMAQELGSAVDLLVVYRTNDHNVQPVLDGGKRLVKDGTLRGVVGHAVNPSHSASEQMAEWQQIAATIRVRGTELVVLHHFHSPFLADPRRPIEQIKRMPHRPIVAITNGDPYYNGLFFRPEFPRMFLQAAEVADMVFSTSMGQSADYIVSRTGARMALLPFGACQVRFGELPVRERRPARFRVVFIGSVNRSRNPLKGYYWYARRRAALMRKLQARFGDGVAVFGGGWEGVAGWQGPIPFNQQLEACRSAEVVVGGVSFSPARYYASDRPFNQIMSGVPFVDLAVEGVEHLLRDGEHWHLGRSLDEVVDICDELLSWPARRRADMGGAAAQFVRSRHTGEDRVRSMVSTLTSLRDAEMGGSKPPAADLRFFLPEVDVEAERPLASRRLAKPSVA